jgi:hypothetical protein
MDCLSCFYGYFGYYSDSFKIIFLDYELDYDLVMFSLELVLISGESCF